MKSLANEFFKTMQEGAARHQAAHPEAYELVATGIKDEQDVARQIAIVEQMIARRVEAIVLAPADSKALVAVARKAVDAGIVVVNIDNRLDADAMAERKRPMPFVGPDNRKGARAVGDVRRATAARGRSGGDHRRGAERVQRHPAEARVQGRRARRPDSDRRASQTASWETARANQVATALIVERHLT